MMKLWLLIGVSGLTLAIIVGFLLFIPAGWLYRGVTEATRRTLFRGPTPARSLNTTTVGR